jgi:hypothetical protein
MPTADKARHSGASRAVIPANTGIQFVGLTALKIDQIYKLDSALRRNDGRFVGRVGKNHRLRDETAP